MGRHRAINVAIVTLASAGVTTLLGFNEVGRAVISGQIRTIYCLFVTSFIFSCLWLLEIFRPRLCNNYFVGCVCGIAIGLGSGALATLLIAYTKLGSWRLISSGSSWLETLFPFLFGSLITGSWLQGLLATVLLCRANRRCESGKA